MNIKMSMSDIKTLILALNVAADSENSAADALTSNGKPIPGYEDSYKLHLEMERIFILLRRKISQQADNAKISKSCDTIPS